MATPVAGHAAGIRVVAVQDMDEKEVRIFGYGKYVGDEVPDNKALGLARLCHIMNRKNPKIVLDSGDVVWGGECWWGPVEGFTKEVGARKLTTVPLPKREEHPSREMFES